MLTRRRFKQETTLQDRLDSFAREMREQAEKLPTGKERDDLIKKARRADTANHLNEWANSPGLLPPK